MLDTKWDMDEALRVRGEEERAEGQKEMAALLTGVFSWVKEEFGIAKAAEIMENPEECASYMDKFRKSPDYSRFMGV